MTQTEEGVLKKWIFVSVGDDEEEREEDTEKTIFLDPNDRRLLHIKDSDGTELTYFGTKDTAGNALSVDEFIIRKADKTTVVSTDSTGRPVRLLAEDGSRIEINWSTETKPVVSYTSGDGASQVITEIDLESLGTELGAVRELHYTSKVSKDQAAGPLRRRMQPSGTVSIELLRCNTEPVTDAIVELDVRLDASAGVFRIDTYLAQHSGNGIYTVFVPDSAVTEVQPLQDTCETLAKALGDVCAGIGVLPQGSEVGICVAIATGLGGLAPEASAACEAAFGAGLLTCGTLGVSPVPGATDIATTLCAAGSFSPPAPIVAEQVTLLPRVLSPAGTVVDPQTVPASGPYPSFSVSTVGGNKPEVVTFTIDPADPVPFQNYVATAEVTCAADSIRLTIIGTDDYSDEAICGVSDGSATSECSLNVPGAVAEILDKVTLFIDGELARSIEIVF